MKKSVFLVFCTFIVFGLMAGLPSLITVNVPNGSTTWNVGTSQTITWTADPSISGTNVKIRLMKGHGGPEDLILAITDSTTNDGSYSWPIPASLTPGSYLIRVKTIDNNHGDDGDFFTMAPAPGAASITVNIPNGSTSWQRGTTKTITWTSVNTGGTNVKIRLMKGHGGPEDLILPITNSVADTGSYSWPIPASLAPGSYLIRVKTIDEATGDDGSFFNITTGSSPDGPTLYSYRFFVDSPKATSKWRAGSTRPITWKRSFLFRTKLQPKWKPLRKVQLEKQHLKVAKLQGLLQLIKSVKIEYRRVNCKLFPLMKKYVLWSPIRNKAFDGKYGGTYNWLVPMKPGCYKIRVTENKTKGRSAISKTFQIVVYRKLKPGIFKKKVAVVELKD